MDTAQIALVVGIVSLIATIVFSALNYRTAKRASDRATATDARTVERSSVIWEATLAHSGYVILRNAGSDPAHKVRVKFWVMTRRADDDPGIKPMALRSDDAIDLERFTSTFSHRKTKSLMVPGQAIGLPVPPSLPQSPLGQGATGARFGLRLHIEWFSDLGNHKSETLFSEDLGVLFAGYVFPDIEALPFERYATIEEAVDPELTPEDLPRG